MKRPAHEAPVEPEPPKDSVPGSLRPPLLLASKEQPSEVLSQSQRAVREADRHYHSGKFFLQEGKPAEARREFDMAVNVLLDVPEQAPDRSLAEKKLEEIIRLIHRYDIDSLGAGVSPESPVFVHSPLPEILDLTFPIDPQLKGKALASLAAASSTLPLTVNDAVLSYINFFTSPRGKRVIEYGMKRSGKYREMISRVLDEEGIPQELIHLAQAESGFSPRAVSYMAAAGMWQFVRSRGAEYGLGVTKLADDRLDPEKATRAAARHLRDLYAQMGDWYLAMAAYNCGPYCVERAVQRTGYADFWELRARRALPRDTMNYVPAILAMAIVCKNPEAYGIDLSSQDTPQNYDTIRLSAPTSIALLADAADAPASELRELNPAILKSSAPAGYEVHVPKGRGNSILAALESVPAERRVAWRLHRVAEGDTLPLIARRYSAAPAAIVSANSRLDAAFFETLSSGEMLIIPAVLREPPAPVRRAAAARASSRASSQKASTARLATVSHNRRPAGR